MNSDPGELMVSCLLCGCGLIVGIPVVIGLGYLFLGSWAAIGFWIPVLIAIYIAQRWEAESIGRRSDEEQYLAAAMNAKANQELLKQYEKQRADLAQQLYIELKGDVK